jgi:hypothetical protein
MRAPQGCRRTRFVGNFPSASGCTCAVGDSVVLGYAGNHGTAGHIGALSLQWLRAQRHKQVKDGVFVLSHCKLFLSHWCCCADWKGVPFEPQAKWVVGVRTDLRKRNGQSEWPVTFFENEPQLAVFISKDQVFTAYLACLGACLGVA